MHFNHGIEPDYEFANRVKEEDLEKRAEKARGAGEDSDLHGLEGVDHARVMERIHEAGVGSARGKKLAKDFEIPDFLLQDE